MTPIELVEASSGTSVLDVKTRLCPVCSGSGERHSKGFTSDSGVVYPDATYRCSNCESNPNKGTFPAVDIQAIVDHIIVKKGPSKGKVRKSFSSFPEKSCNDLNCPNRLHHNRSYYVWRLARFHGGVDMKMPWTADLLSGNDPFKANLDKVADAVAKVSFGTEMAAAKRWSRAFGII